METFDPLADLAAAVKLQRKLAADARASLETAIPTLTVAIGHHSGQSIKIERLLWSCWNGDLCHTLAGLDSNLAVAVVAMIAGRAFLAGDADGLLRQIICESVSQPPAAVRILDPDHAG